MSDTELPLVSIVTPSLNQGRYIEEAIVSVQEQDYPRIEHVVVDGGSADGTIEILRQYRHLQWVSEPDAGQAAAINKGFRRARGDIFGWLNADDYLLPGAVAAAVETLGRNDCALVHGGWRRVHEDTGATRDVQVVPFDLQRQLDGANVVCQPGSFFTRDAYWAVGGVDESYQYAMDYELWLKLGARYSVCHVDRIQAAYRYHSTSKSISQYDAFVPETLRASRSHGERRLSRIYLDYYLPHERPTLYRLLVAVRLLRAREFAKLASRLRARFARTI